MDNWRLVHDNLHMLKGDLLTTTLGKSMITILGLIKLMLLGNRSQDPDANVERWHTLMDHIYSVIDPEQGAPDQPAEKSSSLLGLP